MFRGRKECAVRETVYSQCGAGKDFDWYCEGEKVVSNGYVCYYFHN